MKKTLIALTLVQILLAGQASAALLLVDTGSGGSFSGSSLEKDQWLAAEFSLGAAYKITEVQGWIGIGGTTEGTATAVIYADDAVSGDVPGTQMHSAVFTADGVADWDGPGGLDWNLAAGTYWVAFEVRTGQTLSSAMNGQGVPNPLVNEAYNPNRTGYLGEDRLNIGVRIYGVTPGNGGGNNGDIPEPASLALLGIGLAGLGFTRRKKA